MDRIQHDIPVDLKDVSIEELADRRIVRYGDLEPDWDAFADSQLEGRRRGQFRLIGAGGSGKPDPNALPAGGFTLSIMILPPGQGGSAHTHEVEEAFFVLEGELTVFFQDDARTLFSQLSMPSGPCSLCSLHSVCFLRSPASIL